MFSLKMVARPDARMVEVPLEIEAELPRDFEGAALLSSSGLPRKLKIKAQRDALKLSTAYRADQLLADIVRTVLRGSPIDVERVQIAAKNFVRSVRERRQDGAMLTVESNGRGRIQVKEAMPQPRSATAAVKRVVEGTVSDRIAVLERRLDQLEARLSRGGAPEGTDRVATVEKRLAALEERPAGAAVGEPQRGVLKGRGTAIEPFADGLRTELRDRLAAHRSKAQEIAARCDKAAALAVEAERVLRARNEGISKHLLTVSAQAASRVQALERVHGEVELYAASDLPLAERLVARLVEGGLPPEPTGPLERQAQALVRVARKESAELRDWLTRAAALCGWELIEPAAGEALSARLHVAVDSGGDHVARVAAPGVRRKDGSILCRARVLVSTDPHAAAITPAGAEEIELLAEEFTDEQKAARPRDDTPPPIDDRTPTQPLPDERAAAIEPTQRLAMPKASTLEAQTPPPTAASPELPVPPPPSIPLAQPAPGPGAMSDSAPESLSAPESVATPEPLPAPESIAAAEKSIPPPPPIAAPEPVASPQSIPERVFSAAGGAVPPPRPAAAPEPVASLESVPTPVFAAAAELAASTETATAEDPAEPELELLPPADPPTAVVPRPSLEPSGDDLALATEVAAAVEVEIDEDPEWALLARGPAAFPVDGAQPDVSPDKQGDEGPEPDGPRDS